MSHRAAGPWRAWMPLALFLACLIATTACRTGEEPYSAHHGLSPQGVGVPPTTPHPGGITCPAYAPNPALPAEDLASPAPSGVKMAGVRSRDGSVHLADVDGDGMVDLIQCEDKSPTAVGANDYRWELHRWTPDVPGWEIAGAPIDVLYHYPCDVELQTVDLDADGKVDLVVPRAAEVAGGIAFLATYAALSRMEGGSWESRETGLLAGVVRFLDVNGDGLPDAVKSDGSHQLSTYLNTGVGFAPAVPSLQAPIPAGADTFLHLAGLLDDEGDGRVDLLTG